MHFIKLTEAWKGEAIYIDPWSIEAVCLGDLRIVGGIPARFTRVDLACQSHEVKESRQEVVRMAEGVINGGTEKEETKIKKNWLSWF